MPPYVKQDVINSERITGTREWLLTLRCRHTIRRKAGSEKIKVANCMKCGSEAIKLTDGDWKNVFEIRCRSKRGQCLVAEEQALIERAFREDPDRYGKMEADVFDATVPFDSQVKAKR